MIATACVVAPTPTPGSSATAEASSLAGSPSANASPAAGPFWSLVPTETPSDARITLTAVAVAPDGRALAVGQDQRTGAMAVARSDDAITWTVDTGDPLFDDALPSAVTPFNGGFVIAGVRDGTTPAAWYGSGREGEAWERAELPIEDHSLGQVTGAAVIGERVVIVGERAWYSDDGTTWSLADAEPGATIPRPDVAPDVGCSSGLVALDLVARRLVAVGANWCTSVGELWSSDDGVHWEVAVGSMPSVAFVRTLLDVDGVLTAFGTADLLAGSWKLDGDSFVEVDRFDAAGASEMLDVVEVANGYLAILDGSIWHSTDALAWRPALALPTGSAVHGLTWTGDGAIAVGIGPGGQPAVWTNPTRSGSSVAVTRTETGHVGGQWTERAPTPVRGVTAAAAAADGSVIAFGAVTADDPAMPVVQRYDVRSDAWTVEPVVLPDPGWLGSAARHRETVVVTLEWDSSVQLTAWDAIGRRLVPVGAPLPETWNASLADVDGTLVMTAWDSRAGASGLWLLDDATLEWRPGSAPPGPVEAMGGASDGRVVHAMIRGRLWTYDLRTDVWDAGPISPMRRASAALAVDRMGTVWLMGGITAIRPDDTILAAVPGEGWALGPDLPTPREQPAAVVLADGSILVVGGWTNAGPRDATELLQPPESQKTPTASRRRVGRLGASIGRS